MCLNIQANPSEQLCQAALLWQCNAKSLLDSVRLKVAKRIRNLNLVNLYLDLFLILIISKHQTTCYFVSNILFQKFKIFLKSTEQTKGLLKIFQFITTVL